MIKITDYNGFFIEQSKIQERNVKIEQAVTEILDNVRTRGDEAVREYTLKFDKVKLDSFLLTEVEWQAGIDKVDKAYLDMLLEAKANIERFHSLQKIEDYRIENEDGTVLGQRVTALNRVAIYVPGGTASYPSTVLMNAIPAKLAGVSEIVMLTPPDKNGEIKPEVLAAARLAGVDKIFKLGGAQAIAAVSFGTQSVPKADKITGPGNVYVATAKKLCYGMVDIDMIAGPSEVLIIADDSANASFVAADMLAQAEHDVIARAMLITSSKNLAYSVSQQIELQLKDLSRKDIATASIQNKGIIVITEDIDTAISLANEVAPEHLELALNNADKYLDKIQNAGCIFLGHYTPEALGDYFAGTNHTLPTNGTAKFSSPLSVYDFLKRTSYIYYTKNALLSCADKIEMFAQSEGLTAHKNSVSIRRADE